MSAAIGHTAPRPARRTEIDVLKAVAIVTVVWIHAAAPWPLPLRPALWDMVTLTRFAVPAFLFAAGFLYFAPTPIPVAVVGRRLQRLLVPYAVASFAAFAGRRLVGEPLPATQAIYELLTGSAVGVYYFVPVLAAAVALLPLLSKRRGLAVPLFAVFAAAGLASELYFPGARLSPDRDPFFWEFRSPLRWWGYFLAGWVVARYYGQIRGWPLGVVRGLGALAAAVLVASFTYYVDTVPPGYTLQGGAVHYAIIYATLGSVFFLAFGTPERAVVRWLSEATYPLYLYHPFFITAWQMALPRYFPGVTLVPDPIAFIVGFLGAIGVVVGGRRILGPYARLLLG